MGIAHAGLANRYYDVRYMRLISGRSDLPFRAFRIKAFLKAPKRKSTRRQKIPFSVDFLTWLQHSRLDGNGNSDSHVCVWDAIMMGFFH